MNERIEINPNVCHGSPVIRGTRVLVSQILGALSGGDSVETVLEDYPSITADIRLKDSRFVNRNRTAMIECHAVFLPKYWSKIGIRASHPRPWRSS